MSRISHRLLPDAIEVRVASTKDRFTIIFLPIWLIGWAFGWVSAAANLTGDTELGGKAFLMVWLVFWSIAGVMVFWLLAWKTAGKEIITKTKDQLTIQRNILGFGKVEKYDLSKINNLRARGYFGEEEKKGFKEQFGMVGGVVAFNYPDELIKFGGQLTEQEALQVVGLLKDDITN